MRELTVAEKAKIEQIRSDYEYGDPDTITQWDAEYVINTFYKMIGEEGRTISWLHDTVQAQFIRGDRCGVCAMTTAQAAAEGYNCREEC